MGRFDETVCHCALNRIFGFEPRVALALIEALGSASAIFELSRSGLDDILGPFSKHRDDITLRALEQAADELNRLGEAGARFLPVSDPDFPELLKQCEDPPVGLYYKSISEPAGIFGNPETIAVVGTRDISPYGVEWCERLVGGIARSGARPTIVSGLALGTDITAHRTALRSKVPTIAVMATGIDEVYPYRHQRDADEIASTPGCALVTDYPPGTAPLQVNFLRRNRIIAGISRATILIESKLRGGGMMTANLAFSYGREVHALPGRIDDIRSQGCNHLILNRVAEPIINEIELGRSLRLNIQRSTGKKNLATAVRNLYGEAVDEDVLARMTKLLETIRENRGVTVEELAAKCGFPYKDTMETVSLFEADGLICLDILQRCSINVK